MMFLSSWALVCERIWGKCNALPISFENVVTHTKTRSLIPKRGRLTRTRADPAYTAFWYAVEWVESRNAAKDKRCSHRSALPCLSRPAISTIGITFYSSTVTYLSYSTPLTSFYVNLSRAPHASSHGWAMEGNKEQKILHFTARIQLWTSLVIAFILSNRIESHFIVMI